ncbi:hypothetical protein [Bradyrhizobium sp. CSS354]|nr:hypothetical protein [Bradyrhizobium sp. CSS354]MDE5466193.1 hypothetical protein [Bradyrhizobium sp. CSS354]
MSSEASSIFSSRISSLVVVPLGIPNSSFTGVLLAGLATVTIDLTAAPR